MSLKAEDIKRQAAGRCCQILQSVCGLSAEQLNPAAHGPCPKCGGKDRFRAFPDVNETGGLLCNQACGSHSDIFSSVMWLMGWNFQETLKRIADAVGMPSSSGSSTPKPEKPKTVHPTAKKAVSALMWSYAKNGQIDKERQPDHGYIYHNADGSEAMVVVRWNLPDGNKTFGQITKIEGGWICGGMPEPRPLLNLPAVIQADTVYVCEGEKAVGAVVGIDLVGTTPSQGAKSPQLSDWSPLNGKRVVILPDNDSDGDAFAGRVAKLIKLQAPEATIEIKLLKDAWDGIPEKGDAFDWRKHYEFTEPAILREQIESLPNQISKYDTEPENDPGQETKSTTNAASFAGQSAPELWALADEPVRWMVEDVFSLDQPTVIGARKKSLKTTLLSSLVVSLVTGLLWLSRFKIPRKFRVLFVTGEATKRAAIRKIRRAADALNVKAGDLEGLRIEAVNFPKFPSESDLATISEDIKLHKIDIVVIDPLYRGMDGSINAQNIFEMGDALGKFMAACQPASVILSHHVKKSAQFDKSGMPDLDDLSQAGVAEFAGNYMLIGRLAKYQGDGQHDLAISGGGRDEQFFEYRLEFNERTFTGHLTDLKDHEAHRQQQEENSKVVEMIGKVIEELQAMPDGESESRLATLCGTKPDRKPFRMTLKELEERGTIVCLREFKQPRSRACKGWKLSELPSDKTTSDKTTSDKTTSDKTTSDTVRADCPSCPS